MIALLPHLLLLLVVSAPTSTSAGGAPPMYRDCPNTPGGTYAPNSTYWDALNALAAALIKNATAFGSAAGSAGAAPDVVYGVALCRGDSKGSICTDRLTDAFAAAMNKSDSPICELHRNVTLYYDRHQLSFSDRDFLSGYGNEPEWPENNTNFVNASVAGPFRARVAQLLNAAADAAASRPDRYAAGESWFEEGGKPVYALAQCTSDMARERCRACLRGVISGMPRKLNASQIGGRVIGVRCVVRYEMDLFFQMDNMTLHLGMPNPRARSELQKLSVAIQNVITLWRLEEGNSGFSLYDFSEIKTATGDFSNENMLGQGGFGSVYKGELRNGLEVAAKRLAACSGQGLHEFKNEIQLVAKLQHRNLVRLLGCCIQGDEEKILVYEYMPNKSLDMFIFDNVKRHVLNWPKRLHIIDGISQGLLYLHEHSTVCVVHRDLKASNILLDSEMNAKISDFGIARIFCSNATQSSTTRIVGTIGYIAPEYTLDGVCSVKSDVFSFGVLVLEIISGKKTSGSYQYKGKLYCLIAYAWQLWRDGRWHELIDPCLGDGHHATLKRCTQVALLCVQEEAGDRPPMDEVVKLLSNGGASLPEPKQSAYFNVRPGGAADAPPSSDISISTITLPR
ncbi:cysteine-rich receptor-like protein kinase 25 [Phragmites australis]|uniref:cysteine-rich receptor-like protein kinase 25 n=1 Tax=Phragmites australis TaxID=29695 RepID=UPI002D79D0CF|nr:cysteine-rich receptor-like protein kinase 25 [Phragmites australis]